MTTYKRLIAIDPSLTCSGFAVFDLRKQDIITVGNIKSKKDGSLSERLSDFQKKVLIFFDALKISSADILVCEEATTIIDPRATLVVEQVRCIFEVLAREKKVLVPGRINPRTVQYEIMGLKGSQIDREHVKKIARDTVKAICADKLKNIGFLEKDILKKSNQDIIDAVLIGVLGVSRVQSAINSKVSLDTVFTSNYRRRRWGDC